MRLASLADVPGMAALAADHFPGTLEELVGLLTESMTDAETCVGVVVVEADELTAWGMVRHLTPKVVDEEHAPPGWYLLGVIVRSDRRRRGHGDALTRVRLDWLSSRTDRVYYFTAADNEASQRLHAAFGFHRVRGGLTHRTLAFDGGPMTLFERSLSSASGPPG